ncbi:MAG: YciI family protein [Alphaproteobacteria bacterium]
MPTYFFYCRDKPDTRETRKAIVEAHWAFMDTYADRMVARGPTLADDGETPTGSMHIVELPDAEAARVFAYDEPYAKAGVFEDIIVRRWRNALGQTMWDFEGDPENNQRFLLIGHGRPDRTAERDGLLEAHREYFIDGGYLPRFIERGPLYNDDESEWVGSAMLIEFPDRAAVEEMLADEPYCKAGLYTSVDIHPWRFGGRH